MKHFFYSRLAFSNIKKNSQIYVPYILASAFTVMMFYLVMSLCLDDGLRNSSTSLTFMLELGSLVVIIFSIIFLFYINSFVMKRRKKEVALYNILGMEKRHVMHMMLDESLMTMCLSMGAGIITGIVFSKLMFLLLVHALNIQTDMAFHISLIAVIITIVIYGLIFFLSYLFNMIQIHMSNPMMLLRGEQTGEKEPKAKWFIALLGALSLGAGYYIALSITDPIEALAFFFIAVVLVIIGTYCLFTAGSIVILKLLKKNKHFYYQTRHFTAISQLLYRMKQNAVGLASICILCTCILVMLSSTVSLMFGLEDTVSLAQEDDLVIELRGETDENDGYHNIDRKEMNQFLQRVLVDLDGDVKDYHLAYQYVQRVDVKDNQIVINPQASGVADHIYNMTAMSANEYNYSNQADVSLKENEVLIYDPSLNLQGSLMINGKEFQIKKTIQNANVNRDNQYIKYLGVVFSSDDVLQNALYDEDYSVHPYYNLTMNFQSQLSDSKKQEINKEVSRVAFGTWSFSFKDDMRDSYLDMYGSLFFLGIYLGVLFLMAAILIMYYKQLSEGYEDQKRYEIMQNVGMTKKEVKQSISSQVLIFFFLPIVVAMIHMAFALPMIIKIFNMMILSTDMLFIECTIGSCIGLALIYAVVYLLTAKTYYRIVEK